MHQWGPCGGRGAQATRRERERRVRDRVHVRVQISAQVRMHVTNTGAKRARRGQGAHRPRADPAQCYGGINVGAGRDCECGQRTHKRAPLSVHRCAWGGGARGVGAGLCKQKARV